MIASRWLLAAASSLALAACTTAPDYVAPIATPSAAGAFVGANTPGVSATLPVERDWWRLYRDPVLDRLVQDALAANTDIRVAVARLARARASLREVRSDRLPQAA